MGIKREIWGTMPDGREAYLFTLTNDRGMTASISNYGATLVGLTSPDRNGVMGDVVLGYDTLSEYFEDQSFMGCTVGRVANRISSAGFELNGIKFELDANQGEHHHHGGSQGFNIKLWDADVVDALDGPELVLSYQSPEGEQGYPGSLSVTVVYKLTHDGLRLMFGAETENPTVVNLANHAYFNLSCNRDEDIRDHVLTLNATTYLVTDDQLIPTGEIAEVSGTPLDFTRSKAIGLEIDSPHEAIRFGQGYDHCFVIEGDPNELTPAAQVFHADSGRVLEVCTTQPCIQLYTGNHLPECFTGKLGMMYGSRYGFCLEAQGYVDAPNRKEFPAITLMPGEIYEHVTEYRFSTM